MIVQVLDLGRIEYKAAWDLQNQYAGEIAEGERPPTLLLLEHPHVYTFGRRGKQENLLWGESQLREKGIDIHWVESKASRLWKGKVWRLWTPYEFPRQITLAMCASWSKRSLWRWRVLGSRPGKGRR